MYLFNLSALISLPRQGLTRARQNLFTAARAVQRWGQPLQRLRWKRVAVVAVLIAAVAGTGWWLAASHGITIRPVQVGQEQEPQLAGGAAVTLPEVDGAATSGTASEEEPDNDTLETGTAGDEVLTVMERPVEGEVLAAFSFRYEPTYGDYRLHPGIDLQATEGTPVKAGWAGRVSGIAYAPEKGYWVTVEHAQGYQTVYSNLGRVLVLDGDSVSQGQIIGTVGAPGVAEADRGPHLHLEVRHDGEPVNPVDFLPPSNF